VIKNKDTIIKSIYTNTNDLSSLVLAKFLIIQLRWLTQSSNNPNSAQSIHLRIIDYFTDPTTHASFNQANQNLSVSRLLFNHLIKNGWNDVAFAPFSTSFLKILTIPSALDYIKKLVEFSIIKIPSSVHFIVSSPIANSIAHLFYRCFVHLESNAENSKEVADFK
jgi:hypothetical protein